MIVLFRVDHRLLHGQVIFSWTSALKPDCILVANDDVASDELRKTTLRLSKPNDVKLVIKNIDDSIAAINGGKTDKYHLMIVVSNVADATRMALASNRLPPSTWAAPSPLTRPSRSQSPSTSPTRTLRCSRMPRIRASRYTSRESPATRRSRSRHSAGRQIEGEENLCFGKRSLWVLSPSSATATT